MTLEAIQTAIPHRPPFLLIDAVLEQSDDRIVCRKLFTGDEFWYQGHYPDYPLTPGVLLCEAAMQAGAVLLSEITKQAQENEIPDGVPVVTRMNNVQFRAMVHPGDEIEIEVNLTERLQVVLEGTIVIFDRSQNQAHCIQASDFVLKIAERFGGLVRSAKVV